MKGMTYPLVFNGLDSDRAHLLQVCRRDQTFLAVFDSMPGFASSCLRIHAERATSTPRARRSVTLSYSAAELLNLHGHAEPGRPRRWSFDAVEGSSSSAFNIAVTSERSSFWTFSNRWRIFSASVVSLPMATSASMIFF